MGTSLLRDFVIANERMDSFPQKTLRGIWQEKIDALSSLTSKQPMHFVFRGKQFLCVKRLQRQAFLSAPARRLATLLTCYSR